MVFMVVVRRLDVHEQLNKWLILGSDRAALNAVASILYGDGADLSPNLVRIVRIAARDHNFHVIVARDLQEPAIFLRQTMNCVTGLLQFGCGPIGVVLNLISEGD